MASIHAMEWSQALQEEFKSLCCMGVYKLVPRSSVPPDRKVMQGRPIFKLKRDAEVNPSHFKACYVCHGYTTIFSQDYSKTSSPTARLESFYILAHIGAALDWEMEQLNIKTKYLNGVLAPNEVCYMEQPEGFVEP